MQQDKRAETVRRGDFAVEWLQSILKSKIGKPFAYGNVNVKVRLQAGEIINVKTADRADYK